MIPFNIFSVAEAGRLFSQDNFQWRLTDYLPPEQPCRYHRLRNVKTSVHKRSSLVKTDTNTQATDARFWVDNYNKSCERTVRSTAEFDFLFLFYNVCYQKVPLTWQFASGEIVALRWRSTHVKTLRRRRSIGGGGGCSGKLSRRWTGRHWRGYHLLFLPHPS